MGVVAQVVRFAAGIAVAFLASAKNLLSGIGMLDVQGPEYPGRGKKLAHGQSPSSRMDVRQEPRRGYISEPGREGEPRPVDTSPKPAPSSTRDAGTVERIPDPNSPEIIRNPGAPERRSPRPLGRGRRQSPNWE